MQSAKGKTKTWIIDWDVLQGAGRWENPLIGWASTADYMQGSSLAFTTKEDAIAFVSTEFGLFVGGGAAIWLRYGLCDGIWSRG